MSTGAVFDSTQGEGAIQSEKGLSKSAEAFSVSETRLLAGWNESMLTKEATMNQSSSPNDLIIRTLTRHRSATISHVTIRNRITTAASWGPRSSILRFENRRASKDLDSAGRRSSYSSDDRKEKKNEERTEPSTSDRTPESRGSRGSSQSSERQDIVLFLQRL